MKITEFLSQYPTACTTGQKWALGLVKKNITDMSALWTHAELLPDWRIWVYCHAPCVANQQKMEWALWLAHHTEKFMADDRSKAVIRALELWCRSLDNDGAMQSECQIQAVLDDARRADNEAQTLYFSTAEPGVDKKWAAAPWVSASFALKLAIIFDWEVRNRRATSPKSMARTNMALRLYTLNIFAQSAVYAAARDEELAVPIAANRTDGVELHIAEHLLDVNPNLFAAIAEDNNHQQDNETR